MLKAGIIGCGNIARMHAEALKNMEDAEIQVFADCVPERAARYKEAYGTREAVCCDSLEQMLEERKPDVIHICTPHYLHIPMAVTALEHGVHVFMEKPPAICREDFQRLQEAQKKSGKYVGVCFQNRYNDSVGEILRELDHGDVGKVLGARAFLTWARDAGYYEKSGWWGALKTEGGGVLINQAIHTVDLLVQFLGTPVQAEASMANHHLKGEIEVEDTVEAYIRFKEASACFFASNAYVTDSPVLVELECENGRIRMEENELRIQYKNGTGKTFSYAKPSGGGKAYWGNSHGRCIADYYRCLRTGEVFRNDLDGVKETFSLAMDLYESARTGKPVLCGKDM